MGDIDYSGHGQWGAIQHALASIGGDGIGTVLDIGAGDGITGSNSMNLIERGWSATLVEGSPRAFSRLYDNMVRHPARARISLYNIMIRTAPSIGSIDWFHDTSNPVDGRATLHAEWAMRMQDIHGDERVYDWGYNVATVSASEFWHVVGTHHDIISIDIEGGSTALLLHCPEAQIRHAKVIIAERDGMLYSSGCADMLRAIGYTELLSTTSDVIWVKS